MGLKHVEYFHESSPVWLEERINSWAENNDCEPISISAFMDGSEFLAFVVMEDRDDGK